MFNKDQYVKTKWISHNIENFKRYGYKFNGINKEIIVKAYELPINSRQRVNVICDYCGNEYNAFYCTIANDKYNKHACKNCASIKSNEIRRLNNSVKKLKAAKDICKTNNYILLTKPDEYSGVKMNINFWCNKHGLQTMMLDNLLRGHKCRECSYESRSCNKVSTEELINRIEKNSHNKLLNPCEYKGVFIPNLKIQCSCGNIYYTSLSNYSKQTRCKICSQKESTAELRIRTFLERVNINYEQEKRFEGCRDIKPLPFDFYLPKYNMCIEFDGQQHFTPIYSKEEYLKTVFHDKIKDAYCNDNNIKLIRIPYYDGNNIENIITKSILELQV